MPVITPKERRGEARSERGGGAGGAGEPGGKKWKRAVDEVLRSATSVEQLLEATLGAIPDEVLDRAPSASPPTPQDGCSERVHLATLPSRGKGFTAADPVVAPTEALAV